MDNKENGNMVPSQNNNSEELNKDEGIKVINNELELKIEEKKEEVKVEEVKPVEKKEGKRILPWLNNDDLFIICMGLLLIIVAFNLENIEKLLSKRKYNLNPSTINTQENKPIEEEKIEEITLNCTKKNDPNLYAYDYNYIVNYKKGAYKITYEIKAIDLTNASDEVINEYNSLAYQTANYIMNASNIKGSKITNNIDGTFTQVIDLTVANKKDINKIEEVMPFNVDDSIEKIKSSLETDGYTCK